MWTPTRCHQSGDLRTHPSDGTHRNHAAAREAMEARKIEEREPLRAPLDLLAQHLVTLALGGGFGGKRNPERNPLGLVLSAYH